MPHSIVDVSTTNSQHGSLELTEEIISLRAYQLFEKRGRVHGHDLEDWLQAEAEIFGGKPAASEVKEAKGKSMAAAA